jgi:myo-inositol-1(or 4)-monophosphatase
MTVINNDPILGVAVHAARRAASVILDAARDIKRRPAHARDQADIAAAAEVEAENAVIATVRAAFPAHAIVGKAAGEIVSQIEGRAGGGTNAVRWIVDPLDGIANFARGYPYFAVSIAHGQGGEITHAVVLDPVRDELFTATRGCGAALNGAPIRTSTCIRLDEALAGTAFPTRTSPRMRSCLGLFDALVGQCAGVRRAGACALDLAYVASGRLDGYWATGLKPWDVAGGALLVGEAGGRVGDFAGGTDYLRTGELIAAAPGLFNPLREAIVAAGPPR